MLEKEKLMGKKTVEIVGILDRSGSMGHLIEETITGYNAFIKEQREVGPAKVTLAIFDDQYEVLYDRLSINKVPKLTQADFYARGMTALRDAVGKTISTVRGSQKNGEKPDKTLVFIVTDGYENASSEYDHDDIKKMIKKRTKKGWEFFFMGADIDAFDQGGTIGVIHHNIVKTPKTKTGVLQSYKAVSNTANLYRGGGSMSASYTMEDMYNDSGDSPWTDAQTGDQPGDTSISWGDLPTYTSDEEEDE
jgi:uncharacterized protein YegL